ncbi:MAG: family 16 glycoside hydrolase [Candidatus Binataceae bacterium]
MTAKAWLRSAVVVAAGVAFTMALTSPAAWSRAKKKKVEPTMTPTVTPTATPTPAVKVWNFDQDKAGVPAAGWTPVVGDWQVIPDPTAPSRPNTYGLPPGRMMQSLMSALQYYPMTVVTDPTEYSDFTLEASFKSAGGRFDCSGGIIFRYANPNDFYVLSAGCPSDYFQLSRMSGGKMDVLKQTVVPTDKDAWYKIKVVAQGSHFMCYDDNKMIYDFDDSKIAKGRIGLWASDDSQARFDNVTLTLPLDGGSSSSSSAAESSGSATIPPPPPPLPPPPPPPAH